MVKYFSSLFLFLFSLAVFGQNIETKVSVDTTDYLIGDFINLNINVNHPKAIEIFFPSIKDSLKKLELVSSLPVDRTEDEKNVFLTYKFVLAGYDSGAFIVPSFTIPYKTKNDTALQLVQTDSILLFIHTMDVDTTSEIMDIKQPLTIPLDWTFIIIVALAVILAGIFGYYLIVKYMKKKKGTGEEIVIKKLPHEEALDSLNDLKEKKLWQKGFIKEYHTEITGIIRKYYEERFNLPALELTTSEVLDHLKNRAETQGIVDLTGSFLSNADMVKFAKYIPMDSINEEMMNQAEQIIGMTIPNSEIKGENDV